MKESIIKSPKKDSKIQSQGLETKPGPGKWYCDICQKMMSINDRRQHVNGKSHRENLQQQKRQLKPEQPQQPLPSQPPPTQPPLDNYQENLPKQKKPEQPSADHGQENLQNQKNESIPEQVSSDNSFVTVQMQAHIDEIWGIVANVEEAHWSKWMVDMVLPGTQAEWLDVHEGDKIRAVDGIIINELNWLSIKPKLTQGVGCKLTLTRSNVEVITAQFKNHTSEEWGIVGNVEEGHWSEWMIDLVLPKTQGERLGVCAGDRIRGVDSKVITKLNWSTLKQKITQGAACELMLTRIITSQETIESPDLTESLQETLITTESQEEILLPQQEILHSPELIGQGVKRKRESMEGAEGEVMMTQTTPLQESLLTKSQKRKEKARRKRQRKKERDKQQNDDSNTNNNNNSNKKKKYQRQYGRGSRSRW